MIGRGLTHLGSRRPAWLWVIATLLIAMAAILAWAPPARAQDADLIEREMYRNEPPPGRYSPNAYVIFYHVNSPINDDGCGGSSWLGALGGLGGLAASQIACRDVDFRFVGDLFWGLTTESAFSVTRTVSSVGLWVIERAYSFDIAEWMDEPAEALAERINETFVGSIGLDDFAVFLAVFFSGWQILRRRLRQGLSELAASLLVAVIGAMLVANPSWLLDTGVSYSIAMSAGMLELHSGTDTDAAQLESGEYDRLVRPLTNELHEAMIGQPYDLINWGESLTGECAEARDRVLGMLGVAQSVAPNSPVGPGIPANFQSDEAREMMREAGCGERAEFNAKSSDTRLAMAIMSALISLILTLMFVLIAIVVIGSQLVLAQMLVIAPLAVVFGTVPGTGRQLLARWAGVVLQALAAIVVMSFVLTLLLELTTTILRNEELNYSNRFFLLFVAVIMLFRARKKLLGLVEEILERAAERLQVKVGEGASDLLAPGNMIRFGMGAAVGQSLVQQTTGALLGRWFAPKPKPGGGGGPGGAIGGGPGGPFGGGPAGAIGGGPPRAIGPGPGARPATPAARRSMGFRQMLLQGARMVPGAGRATAAAAAGLGRGAGRVARRLPRTVGALPAHGYKGAVLGVAGVAAAGRAGANLVRRTPRAVTYGSVVAGKAIGHGTVAAGKAVGHGTVAAGKAIGHGTVAAGKAIGHGTVAAGKATGKAAQWTGREMADGYWEALGNSYSPTADKLLRYAAGSGHQGKHRAPSQGQHRPGRHRAGGSRPPDGGSGT